MARVAITKSKLDYLANCVAAKSGESVPLTVDEMSAAVLGIELGIDGDNIEYGMTDGTLAMIGVGKIGSMVL